MDLIEDLESLKFEHGIQEQDYSWLYLQGRFRGLMVKACAHATFFCKLLHKLRASLPEKLTNLGESLDNSAAADELRVGIIGGGHLGKQLALTLLQLVPLPARNLRISTRRPETLGEFQKLGIQCFYHNTKLVEWANVVFLCCLPAQLSHICVKIQPSLKEVCIVYSFVAAIPIARLKLLLNHTNILRPQYQCVADFVNFWGTNKDVTAALQDPAILQATCPYSSAGGIVLNIKWLEGVFYAFLNICTAKGLPQTQLQDFVSRLYVKRLPHKRFLPRFDLTAVQLSETPFSQHLSANTALQDHLTYLYCDSFGISLSKQHSTVDSMDSTSP
ncbi:NADP-dependent oxidoreductase domain-containing protein 1 isoform X2 [Talpa occidentalis]|uniref:NADP-dependent oxidoreductase domain-containing protein 1 isoform X2 n=1 Tax=Talpa occidentalis TaxID=50954 RepID=UPI00188EB49F|nr:NADP-dependent oxidoreductase domain-containing protein 1 isoform X2 [Talpa occidentalis]